MSQIFFFILAVGFSLVGFYTIPNEILTTILPLLKNTSYTAILGFFLPFYAFNFMGSLHDRKLNLRARYDHQKFFFWLVVFVITFFLALVSVLALNPARVDVFIIPETLQNTVLEKIIENTFLFPQSLTELFSFYNIYFYTFLAWLFSFSIQGLGSVKQNIYVSISAIEYLSNKVLGYLLFIIYFLLIPDFIELIFLIQDFSLSSSTLSAAKQAVFIEWVIASLGITVIILFVILPLATRILGIKRNFYMQLIDFLKPLTVSFVSGNFLVSFAALYYQWHKKDSFVNRRGNIIIFIGFFLLQTGTVIFASLLFRSILNYYTPLNISILEICSYILILQLINLLPLSGEGHIFIYLTIVRLFFLKGNVPVNFIDSIVFFIPVAQRFALVINTSVTVFLLNYFKQSSRREASVSS